MPQDFSNMYDAIGTQTERGFAQSSLKLLLQLVGSLAFIALCLWMTWDTYKADDPRFLVGFAGMVFFGVVFAATVHRLLVLRGNVVILSPEGFHDRRLTTHMVPWHSIQEVSEWGYRGNSASTIIIAIDPVFADSVRLTLYARLTHPLEKALGIRGLCVLTWSLDITLGRLLTLMRAYAAAAKTQPAVNNSTG
jgi:hypothetical protein